MNTTLYILIAAITLLFIGSAYLIIEGYRVYKLFQESVIGKLVKTLVVVLIIMLYTLGLLSVLYVVETNAQKLEPLIPIAGLWILNVSFVIAAVRTAKKQVIS
jgi:hypothetical protein